MAFTKNRAQMYEGVEVGKAMSEQIGSDSYGYWISEVDPVKNIVGLYSPETHFEDSWQDGTLISAAFDKNRKSKYFLTAYRGKWYRINPKTHMRNHSTTLRLTEYPINYRDPSF